MIDRDALAEIVERIAANGTAGPRDLDIAIDAILCLIPGEEGAPAVIRQPMIDVGGTASDGQHDECWVPCSLGDPGAVEFIAVRP